MLRMSKYECGNREREREREREKQRYLRLNFILRVDTICDKHVYMYIYIFRVLNHDL